MQVIPAINAVSFGEAKKQIETAAEFADLIHIDVVDGIFAPNVTWGNPEDLEKLEIRNEKLGFEVHLMVENPEDVIDDWLRTGLVKRVIVHVESISGLRKTAGLAKTSILTKCKKYGAEAMLAINPDTEVERLLGHLDDFQSFQILAVQPGLAGQKFRPEVINKIKFLRQKAPDAIIEVDGGINPETAKLVKEAGADIVVSASYIFESSNSRKTHEELVKI